MKTRIGAHRGIHTEEVENTLSALLAAEAEGVDFVEFDVRQTVDRVWALFHDARFEGHWVKNTRFDTLLELAAQKGFQLTTLDEVIDKVKVHLNIECKENSDEAGSELARHLESCTREDLNISSFSKKTLRGFYEENNETKLSLLGVFLPKFTWASFNKKIPIYSINQRHTTLREKKIKKAQSLNIEVHTWTVNSPQDIRKFLNWGVDAIISDNPVEAMSLRDEFIKNSQF